MKTITPSRNSPHWPRYAVKNVETRKRDLVIRLTDWTDDEDEPAYDVEMYIGGVYDFTLSKTFTCNGGRTKAQAKDQAAVFASRQIGELL